MYSLVKKQNKNITNKMINLFTLQTITNITNDYKWLQILQILLYFIVLTLTLLFILTCKKGYLGTYLLNYCKRNTSTELL